MLKDAYNKGYLKGLKSVSDEILDVAGLGLIATPYVAEALGKKVSHGESGAYELAGLGLLAVPPGKKIVKRFMKKGEVRTAIQGEIASGDFINDAHKIMPRRIYRQYAAALDGGVQAQDMAQKLAPYWRKWRNLQENKAALPEKLPAGALT